MLQDLSIHANLFRLYLHQLIFQLPFLLSSDDFPNLIYYLLCIQYLLDILGRVSKIIPARCTPHFA